MKIGFEAKRAFQNYTGLGNYARSLIGILASQYPTNQYFLYAPRVVKNSRTEGLFSLSNTTVRAAPIKLFKSFWRSKGVVKDLKKDGIQVYHGLSNELPAGLKRAGIKSVVTIHDLIFLRYPQYFKFLDRKIYEYKFRKACDNADLIIAISEQTKRDIIYYFDTSESKIKVIYQGCDPIFYNRQSEANLSNVKNKYNLAHDYLLCVGTIESRKNQLLILKALMNLPESISLVLVGKATAYQKIIDQFIRDNKLENRVQILNGIPYSELPAIYQLAKVFVYPSEFEGFGIPILEALNSGIPVVAAKGSCLEEAGGANSLYIDANNAEELSQQILKLFADENLRKEMISAGEIYAMNFREEVIAKEIMDTYTSVIAWKI